MDFGYAARPRAPHHPAALPLLADAGHAMLADLSYGRTGGLDPPDQEVAGRRLTAEQRTVNALHAAALVLLHHQHGRTT